MIPVRAEKIYADFLIKPMSKREVKPSQWRLSAARYVQESDDEVEQLTEALNAARDFGVNSIKGGDKKGSRSRKGSDKAPSAKRVRPVRNSRWSRKA